jgi:hypothetical protein
MLAEFFGGSQELLNRWRFDVLIHPFDEPNSFVQVQEPGATNHFVWGTASVHRCSPDTSADTASTDHLEISAFMIRIFYISESYLNLSESPSLFPKLPHVAPWIRKALWSAGRELVNGV